MHIRLPMASSATIVRYVPEGRRELLIKPARRGRMKDIPPKCVDRLAKTQTKNSYKPTNSY